MLFPLCFFRFLLPFSAGAEAEQINQKEECGSKPERPAAVEIAVFAEQAFFNRVEKSHVDFAD